MPATRGPSVDPLSLREAREAAGLSLEAVALSVGRSAPTVKSWESGQRRPPATVVPLLLEVLRSGDSAVLDFVRRTRAASGVPEQIVDPSAARRIAAIFASKEAS
jgi:transcriptional regulator with XRE-family HTH domain